MNHSHKYADRFAMKWMPVPESGCWLWLDALNAKGYGFFCDGKRQQGAHRYSYELHKGAIPEGLTIDHLCRVTCCVNPDHLEAVTSRENTLRSSNVPMLNARKTHCKAGHEFSGNNVMMVEWKNGKRYRQCRECNTSRNRACRARKKEFSNAEAI